jgi:phage-related protein
VGVLRGFSICSPYIHQEGQYRVIYVAKINDAVHVLHAFRKKTQKTRKQDVEIAKRRLQKIIGK